MTWWLRRIWSGDIISDNGATTAGGLGLAVGGNIGDEHAMFEPIHGSAPKHAGKDKANPLAAILAMQMMLDWLGTRHDDERLHARGGESGSCRRGTAQRRQNTNVRFDWRGEGFEVQRGWRRG